MHSIRKRTLIVTGASSGIGRELALQAARLGFNVVANARRTERLATLASEIRAAGGACAVVNGDVTVADTASAIVQTALREFERIDVLINNAGMGVAGNLLDQNEAALDAQWRTHVAAPLRITRAAFPALRESGGQVFFVGSGLARVPAPGFGAYPAAKAAIRAISMQLRRELRGSGVAVTYVDPGGVDTEFSQAAGMRRSSSAMLAHPRDVAARILEAIRTRPVTVSGVPLHAVGVAIGEAFPAIADVAIDRIADKPAPAANALEPDVVRSEPAPEARSDEPVSFERALEPVARRMERVKLPASFVAQLLHPGDELHLADVAMRWAGMPNKNERAAVSEVLDALTTRGFLEKSGDETWRVLRSA